MDWTIIGENVRLAREANGITQADLATRVGAPQAAISKLENGLIEVDPDRLKRIADSLGYPVDLFTADTDRQAVVALFNRKMLTTPVGERKTAEARVNLARLHVERMIDGLEIQPALPFPKFDLSAFDDDVEALATKVRSAWRLPMGPIRDLTGTAEAAGAAIVELDFGSLKIDAASQWPQGGRPYIFLRPDLPGDRWRFNIAHEIGHMVMHDIPGPDREPEANAFAGALLMPASELRAQIPARLTIGSLLELKMHWRVSMQAIVMRAFAIGAITDRQRRTFFQQINTRGIRKLEPMAIPREQPRLVSNVVSAYMDRLAYSPDELAKVALLPADALLRRFAPDRTAPTGPVRHLRAL